MANIALPSQTEPFVDSNGMIRPIWYRILQQLPVLPLPTYTVSGLPTSGVVRVAFASNGRKAGESAGNGTGVMVYYDGTAWRACDTSSTVAA